MNIYIHKFRNGYKVVFADRIKEIYDGKKYNYRRMAKMFSKSPRFRTEGEAVVHAAGGADLLGVKDGIFVV